MSENIMRMWLNIIRGLVPNKQEKLQNRISSMPLAATSNGVEQVHAVKSLETKKFESSTEEESGRRVSSCYLRDSMITRMRTQGVSQDDLVRKLFGLNNVLWVLFSLYFLRLIYDAPKIILMFGLIWASSYAFYLILYLERKKLLSRMLTNALLRFCLLLLLILPCKWVLSCEYPVVPSFSVAAQATCFFLKIHSFVAVVERECWRGTSLDLLLDWKMFSYFLVAPTLVYRVKGYPRTKEIRWKCFFGLFIQGCGLLFVMYLIMTEYMLPLFHNASDIHSIEFVVTLIVPTGIFYLLFFILIFEVMLNGFAELTRFGDRLFYEDWWNSVTHDEFLRKWNRPVYNYLMKIVYSHCRKMGTNRLKAMTLTIAYSSVLHELVLAVSFRRLRLYLMSLMMTQTPLIWLMNILLRIQERRPVYRQISNIFFWNYIFLGPTLLMLIYSREY
ncbi:Sterol O-acyltransferase 2 [Galdieria sulphuraria]|nr:Sterol O-acyltransferase 2 [Galdieria sulphuraria]